MDDEIYDEFVDGFNQGKAFLADYLLEWINTDESIPQETSELLRQKIEGFNNED